MTTDLDRLIEAVEAGEQADGRRDFLALPRGDDVGCNRTFAYRAFHGSLDAAVLLVHSLLPRAGWLLDARADDTTVAVVTTRQARKAPHARSEATTPARALLLATLRAYRSTREGG